MVVAVSLQGHVENLRRCAHLEVPVIRNAHLILPCPHRRLNVLLVRLEVRQVLQGHHYLVDYVLHRTCPLDRQRFLFPAVVQAGTGLRGGVAADEFFQGLLVEVLGVLFQFHGQTQNDECVSSQSEHFGIPIGVKELCGPVTRIGSLGLFVIIFSC